MDSIDNFFPSPTESSCHNPQFHVHIPTGASKCHVVVSVTQQYEGALNHHPATQSRNTSPCDSVSRTGSGNLLINASSAAVAREFGDHRLGKDRLRIQRKICPNF